MVGLSSTIPLCLVLGGIWGSFASDFLNVDYQIHSNNDLKEFRQVLIKGSRKFKFDPHYVSHHTKCGKSKDCFLLNHDLPTTLFSDYNTSTELLNYLASSEFKSLVGDEYISIALCFKSAPDLCKTDSDSFQSWMKLVDDFYAQAVATVSSNVEFILDGDAKPTNCLVGSWLPWKSVWIRTGVSTTDCFTSNSTDGDCYRYQILNNPENVSNWEWMAQEDVNYGKFHDSTYPYQLWEPDKQEDIILYRDMYLNGPQHPAGYHFAINSDIAMFRVYASGVADEESGKPKLLDDGNSVAQGVNQALVKDGVNPLLIPVSATGFTAVYVSATDASAVYTVSVVVNPDKVLVTSGEPIALPQEVASSLALSKSNALAAGISVTSSNATQYTLLMTSSGSLVAYSDASATYYSGSLALNGTVYDIELLDASQCGSSSISDDFNLCVLVASDANGAVSLSTVLLTGKYATGASEVAYTNAFSVSVVSVVTLAVPSEDTLRGVKLAVDSAAKEVLVFTSNSEKRVKGALVSLSVAGGDVSPAWTQITIGQSIDVGYSAESGVLMLVNDYGYCYNSHDHNTRSYPTVCSAEPTPTQYTLDYSLGLLSDWKQVLTLSSRSVDTKGAAPRTAEYAVNSCHDNILHGTYDLGSKPAVAFLPLTSESASPFFLTLHEGFPADSLGVALGGCGDALPREGIVADHFRITEWVAALKQL